MNKNPAPKKRVTKIKAKSTPQTPSPPRVSTEEEWGAMVDQTSIIQLPSGIAIEIKTMLGLVDFAMAGQIPLPLVKKVIEAGEKLTEGVDAWNDMEPEKVASLRTMLERIASVAVVKPKVVLDEKDSGVFVGKIAMQDLLSIFTAVVGRGASINLFRSFRRK